MRRSRAIIDGANTKINTMPTSKLRGKYIAIIPWLGGILYAIIKTSIFLIELIIKN